MFKAFISAMLIFTTSCIQAETIQQQNSFSNVSEICIRFPSESDIKLTEVLLVRLNKERSVKLVARLNCRDSEPVFYISRAIFKHISPMASQHSLPPPTIDCCHGLIPLELNESMFRAPLRYFRLSEFGSKAKVRFTNFSWSGFQSPLLDSELIPKLQQPGFIIYNDDYYPIYGVCVVFIMERDEADNFSKYSLQSQLNACLEKLWGDPQLYTQIDPPEIPAI